MSRSIFSSSYMLILLIVSRTCHFVSAFEADHSRRLSFGQLLASALALQQPKYIPTEAPPSITQPNSSVGTREYLQTCFPNLLTYDNLLQRVTKVLPPQAKTTLLATSLCCDEVNRGLDRVFEEQYGDHFSLGGLAGFPFSGVTGFRAMQSHVPDNGAALIVYGPHIGVDRYGILGKIDRRGQHDETSCCGSAVVASRYVLQSSLLTNAFARQSTNLLDLEQSQVNSFLLPYKNRLAQAINPSLELPFILFQTQDTLMRQIMKQAAPTHPVVLLGGIQINTPAGEPDYFCPLSFEMTNMGNTTASEDLLFKLA